MPSDLTAGIEFNQDKLEDNMWGYHRTVDQKVNIGSAFLQNEWKNDHWGFLLGGRLDKHNLIDHIIFSPRANLRFNPTQNINLRLSYSSGFRAPQAFDEDLHVENVGGNVAMVELAKDLKEERSQSLSASADIYHRFGAFQINFLVEGFYTKLSDVFALTDGEVKDGILTRTRYNAPGARVMGLTLEGKMAYLNKDDAYPEYLRLFYSYLYSGQTVVYRPFRYLYGFDADTSRTCSRIPRQTDYGQYGRLLRYRSEGGIRLQTL